jgi:hypothetical protein
MDSNLISLTLAVLIHWSGARSLIQQGDLDLELLVASIALLTELVQEQRVGTWSMRDYTVSKCDSSHCRLVGQIVEAEGFNIE